MEYIVNKTIVSITTLLLVNCSGLVENEKHWGEQARFEHNHHCKSSLKLRLHADPWCGMEKPDLSRQRKLNHKRK